VCTIPILHAEMEWYTRKHTRKSIKMDNGCKSLQLVSTRGTRDVKSGRRSYRVVSLLEGQDLEDKLVFKLNGKNKKREGAIEQIGLRIDRKWSPNGAGIIRPAYVGEEVNQGRRRAEQVKYIARSNDRVVQRINTGGRGMMLAGQMRNSVRLALERINVIVGLTDGLTFPEWIVVFATRGRTMSGCYDTLFSDKRVGVSVVGTIIGSGVGDRALLIVG